MAIHPFNGKQTRDFWQSVPLSDVRGSCSVHGSCNTRNSLAFTLEYRLNDVDEKTEELTPPTHESVDVQPMALLEAALFLAREPMSSRRLAQLAGLPEGTKTRQLIRELNKRYDQDQSAFCIVEVAEGFQLRTRPEFAPWLVRMQGVPTAVRLSNPAMETLTVIAYRQPIPRAEVERIRGVQCGELIRQLLDQDLAKIVGRSEDLGRPFLYGTTLKFLQVFGLGNLNDLPAMEVK